MINKEDRDGEAKHKREKEAGERPNSGLKARRRKKNNLPSSEFVMLQTM